jgi:uncharacterized protein YjbI with pentapeptide repeats
VDFSGLDLSRVNLSGVDLSGVDFRQSDLRRAILRGSKLYGSNLSGKNLSDADLQGADLRKANLGEANLNRSNLERADLTGAVLFRTAREGWHIEGIQCEYIFCDREGRTPFPKSRVFRPGEFEMLFKQRPSVEFGLEHGFTPLDAFVIDQVIQTVDGEHPEFELKLDSLHASGQPHVSLTVLRQEFAGEALIKVRAAYNAWMATLDLEGARLQKCLQKAIAERRTIIAASDIEKPESNGP